MNDDLIQSDVDRVTKNFRNLMERCYASAEETGDTNVRLDTFLVVGVLAWTDEDGDEREDIIMTCESKKHHVKTGILRDAITVHELRVGVEG